MSHRGRRYPLFVNRLWNADAPYPHWCPEAYDIQLPDSTGTIGAYLSRRLYQIVRPTSTLSGLLYSATDYDSGTLSEIFIDLQVGWVNTDTLPRNIFFRIQSITHPIGFPPYALTLLTSVSSWDPDTQLGHLTYAPTTVPNPLAYDTGDNWHADFRAWGLF